MIPKVCVCLTTILLAACGASGSSNVDTNDVGKSLQAFASSGYAKEGDRITFGDSFLIQNAIRVTGTEGNLSVEEQDVRISIAEGGEAILLEIDGEEFRVPSINGQLYRIDEGDTLVRIFANRFARYEGVYNELELTVIQGEEINVSHIPLGYNSSAADIAKITGTATYAGTLSLEAYDGQNYGEAGGAGEIIVDFDSGALTGEFQLRNLNNFSDDIVGIVGFDGGLIDLPEGTYRLSETAISDNIFEGTVSYDDGSGISDLEVNGTFYGAQAEVVAGTVVGSVSETNFGTEALVTGQLIGSEEF